MKTFDYITRGMTMAVNYSLDTQWRVAVVAMAVLGLVGLLSLLPQPLELPGVTRLVRAFVPVVKVMRLLGARRHDWRGVLLDMLV